MKTDLTWRRQNGFEKKKTFTCHEGNGNNRFDPVEKQIVNQPLSDVNNRFETSISPATKEMAITGLIR
jgi:hypothetical protein